MNPKDKPAFAKLIGDVMAFYRQDVSPFAATVWWGACQSFDMEQVSKALTAHAMDPERGQFPPKPADIVRLLQGTKTDRSLVAWGKVLDAMQRVGAYQSVCFDEGLIHAAIEDVGGWVAICRSQMDELSHLERRFCQSYKAYAARGDVQFPPSLPGEHQLTNSKNGHSTAKPVLIGNPAAAKEVLKLGTNAPKTQITHSTHVVEHLVTSMKQIGNAA